MKWARELAAFGLFYKIAVRLGFIPASPVLTHTVTTPDGGTIEVAELAPTDVRSSHVKWLSPRGYRVWRDVGLAGMLPSGLENESWPGRNDGRDVAFADFTYSSGLRRREAGTLLVWELPPLESGMGGRYYSGWVGKAVAKRAGRFYYVSHAGLQQAELYRLGTRDTVVRRAQRRGRYEQVADRLLLQEITRDRRARWTAPDGRTFEAHVGELTARQRMRMFIEVDEGLKPAMLWLTETGMPMAYKSWTKVFEASERCERAGLRV